MPRIYPDALRLEGKPKVDGGECARLVQHYLAGIGPTSSWRQGENVIDVLASGRTIPKGPPSLTSWMAATPNTAIGTRPCSCGLT